MQMTAGEIRSRITSLRTHLPHGMALSEQAFATRHRAMLWLLAAHVPMLIAVAVGYGYSALHAGEHALPVVAFTLGAWKARTRRAQSTLASAGLLTCSALLVHTTGGLIEAHFHFFVIMIVLAFYEDWAPYGLATGYVFLHHGLAGLGMPYRVFNHPGAEQGAVAWKWAAVHALFIFLAGLASVLLWRANEQSRRQVAEQAQLRSRAQNVSRMLVSSLIPAELPEFDGLRTAARYLPGEGRIGGDFYDVFPVGDDAVFVALGDVAGHGVQAAALTAKLRHSIRAYAQDDMTPGQVLSKVDRVMDDAEMATAAAARICLRTGAMQYALAGHPPLVVCDDERQTRLLAGPPGPPLAGLRTCYSDVAADLQVGSTLLVFSDGLIERRGESLDVGLARVQRALSASPSSPCGLVSHLAEHVLEGQQDDDVALVAVRRVPRSYVPVLRVTDSLLS